MSGGADPHTFSLVSEARCEYVLMHSLSIPADPKQVLSKSEQSLTELKTWAENKLGQLEKARVDLGRVILDPGIGFGKDALQSLIIMRGLEELQKLPTKILVGHSRKSFLKEVAPQNPADRDLESIGVSLALVQKGVDILRVHNPMAHIRAFRGFSHVR